MDYYVHKKPKFPALPKFKRVAAYARVSTKKDALLHSLNAQVSYYSDYIQKHPGWLYCGVYADEGITGTKADRDGFQAMLKACSDGEIDMIITKSTSRFARNTVMLLETVRYLNSIGVDVFFEKENIHSMSGDGELMLSILASFAQAESLSASENQRWRVKKAFENGEVLNWRFLMGYDIGKDSVEINEEEAKLVREVFRRFNAGESMASIARRLNERGLSGTHGAPWKTQSVRNMLANEKYTGNALLWKSFRNNHVEKKKTRNRGEFPRYFAKASHPAIIDDETFARAKERLDEFQSIADQRAPKKESVFSGVIRCGNCGANYIRIKNHQYFAWNCGTYKRRGKAACGGLQIREDILERAAADAMGLDEFDPEEFQKRISSVVSRQDHILIFRFLDGTEQQIEWKKASRSNSWTPEMKERAAQISKERRGETQWP